MKKVSMVLLLALITMTFYSCDGGETNVKGYHRKDGTYVKSHSRSHK